MDGGLVEITASPVSPSPGSPRIPPTLQATAEQVDDVIAAGRDVLRASPTLRAFAGSM
jgi:hypothetical protein